MRKIKAEKIESLLEIAAGMVGLLIAVAIFLVAAAGAIVH